MRSEPSAGPSLGETVARPIAPAQGLGETTARPPQGLGETVARDVTTLATSGASLQQTVRERLADADALADDPIRIGRFTVLSMLGEGGMGVVYAAYDLELDRKVAIKLVRESAIAGTQGHTSMLREAQAMAKLSHPNVVQIYEVGEHDGQVFVAMEFVKGRTLTAWLTEAPRTWKEIRDMFVQASRGLAAAHAEGIVHRDFKPETWSLSRTVPIPPTGRILKNRGDLRGGLCRWAARRAAGLATGWQRAGRTLTRGWASRASWLEIGRASLRRRQSSASAGRRRCDG